MLEMSQINESSYHFKKLDREDQIKHIEHRIKKIKKVLNPQKNNWEIQWKQK